MGGYISSKKQVDDHVVTGKHKQIERRMISHNTHANVASKGVLQRRRQAKKFQRRKTMPSRNRSVYMGAHHAPKGAARPAHRVRRDANHTASSTPSARKRHKREASAWKAVHFGSDVLQATAKNKWMFGI